MNLEEKAAQIYEIRDDLHSNIEILDENLHGILRILEEKLEPILKESIVKDIKDFIEDSLERVEKMEEDLFVLHEDTNDLLKTTENWDELKNALEFF